MKFSQLEVGDKYIYPFGESFDEWRGVWMKSYPYVVKFDDGDFTIEAICIDGPHVGELLDHENDPVFDEAEVYRVV